MDHIHQSLSVINTLRTTGKSYRRKLHFLQDIQAKYLEAAISKNIHILPNYIPKLTTYLTTIFTHISETSPYDAHQFIQDIINWYFKSLAYQYKITKKEPTLPDYILAEIKDIANSITITIPH